VTHHANLSTLLIAEIYRPSAVFFPLIVCMGLCSFTSTQPAFGKAIYGSV